jgi:hypothetical protein
MREIRSYGSARGVPGNRHSYRNYVKLLGMIVSPDNSRYFPIAGTFRTRLPPTRRLGRPFCTRYFGPTREPVFHLFAVRRRGQQMPPWSKMLGNGTVRGQKALGMSS